MAAITVLGVDVGSSSWASNGTALLTFETGIGGASTWTRAQTSVLAWPSTELTPGNLADLLDEYARANICAAISLDGPHAWRDPDRGPPGVGRLCELEARTPGKTGPYGRSYPGNYLGWIRFCIDLFTELLGRPGVLLVSDPAARLLPTPDEGYYLLECFPTNTWRTAGLPPLPGHAKAPPQVVRQFAEDLVSHFDLPEEAITDSHDDLQAVVAACRLQPCSEAPARPFHADSQCTHAIDRTPSKSTTGSRG